MTAFGDIIREWRGIRRFSQLQLAVEADISSRHVSFLESGRSKPSKSMVLKIADALHMPKQSANQALGAAGFAPAFPQLPPDDEALAPIRDAVSMMLQNHEPFPAFALDRHWDVIAMNPAAVQLFVKGGVNGATNAIDAMIAVAEGDAWVNWEEAAYLMLMRLRTEIVQFGGDHVLQRYADQLASHPRLANADIENINFNQAVIPSIFQVGDQRLSLFSTIAQFGSVQEVASADIRIELMFPTDAATREYFQSLS